jgi:hypothetical protein
LYSGHNSFRRQFTYFCGPHLKLLRTGILRETPNIPTPFPSGTPSKKLINIEKFDIAKFGLLHIIQTYLLDAAVLSTHAGLEPNAGIVPTLGTMPKS